MGGPISKTANARHKYSLSLSKTFNKYLIPILDGHEEELSIVLMNRILNRDGPKAIENNNTPETKLLAKVSIGAFEIFNTYESLLDAEVYMRRFPYRGTRISKSRHLKSVTENYFNNVYILKERMVKYLKTLTKIYSKRVTSKGRSTSRITIAIRRFTEEYLAPLKAVRNSHVHQEDFYDLDLERLSILEMYIQSNPTTFGKEAVSDAKILLFCATNSLAAIIWPRTATNHPGDKKRSVQFLVEYATAAKLSLRTISVDLVIRQLLNDQH